MRRSSRAVVLLGTFAARAICDVGPLQMTWNTGTTFGPDGPWQGVMVSVGDNDPPLLDGSPLTLYPGGAWESVIFTTAFCNGSTNACLASEAGLYNNTQSKTANYAVKLEPGVGIWGSDIALNQTDSIKSIVLDSLSFQAKATNFHIPQVVFSAANTSNIILPNGNSYSSQVGLLALGAPNTQQSFTETNGSSINGNLLTGFLKQNGSIPSSSWGLHIGSVMQGQSGSLTLGGYDQSRALGPLASFDLGGGTGANPIVTLIDVGIGVQTGGSPFNSSSIQGLGRFEGNQSAAITLNPSLPYMFLPQATCDAITQYLPVTYQSSSGLYTWNTNDPQYLRIVSSPAYLQFTFQESASRNISIKVPFALLNLTLGTPILNQPTPYFPCKPYYTPDGNYYLGRAFLQAAFLGVTWDQGKFFLAQAPGPNSGPSQITTIQTSDITIQSNSIDTYTASWIDKWTPIPLPSSPSSSNSTNGTVETPSSTKATGISSGAKTGIGIGIAAAAVILLGLLTACFVARRKRRRQHPIQQVQHSPFPSPPPPPPVGEYWRDHKLHFPIEHYPIQHHPSEPRVVHELEVPHIIHETGDGSIPEMSAVRHSRVLPYEVKGD